MRPSLVAGLQAVTGDGYDAILSAPWYLNLGCYASDDWKNYYAGAPAGFEEQLLLCLGRAGCLGRRCWPGAGVAWCWASYTHNSSLLEVACFVLTRSNPIASFAVPPRS